MGPTPVAASPVSIADPDLERLVEAERLLEAVHPVADREAGAHGPHGVVLLDCGRPKTAITASPMNFSGWPRSARSSSLAASKNPPSTSRARSGSSRCARPVESTRSANRTVTIFRSSVPRVVDTGVPQFGQKRAPSGRGWPQNSHRMVPSIGAGTDPVGVAMGDSSVMEVTTFERPEDFRAMARATSRHRARALGRVLQEGFRQSRA